MLKQKVETCCPTDLNAWRKWLQKNHDSRQSIWLVYYKKNSGVTTLTWSEAVDEAICFGWIDSTKRPIDDEKYMQLFSKRKPTSMWSKINKAKVERLMKEKRIAPAGYASIEIAKQNGSWSILDAAEELTIPSDLENEFKTQPGSKAFFMSLSKSVRKSILQWLILAKLPATRQKRITEIAQLASEKLRPKQFR